MTRFRQPRGHVFARYYFTAFDAWTAGRTDQFLRHGASHSTPRRRAPCRQRGDLLLGINAHVQRDLPLVLYAAGLVRPDGASRKADHDRVNVILNRVTGDVIAEIARRFDPTVDDTNLPTSLDEATLFQLLAAWREKAWRNAEMPPRRPPAEARELVVAAIEQDATLEARAIASSTRYPPLSGGSAMRDAFCAANHDDG